MGAGSALAKSECRGKIRVLGLFEDLIVNTYAIRFKSYANEKIKLTGTASRGQTAIVKSVIERGSQQPVRVDWRVTYPDGQYKIFDIVIEGVSMIQTQRSEFSSVMGATADGSRALLQPSKIDPEGCPKLNLRSASNLSLA